MRQVMLFLSVLMLTNNSFAVQNKHINSFTNKEKALKPSELFLEPAHEYEVVFDPEEVENLLPPSLNDKKEILSLQNPQIQSKRLTQLLNCAYELMGTKYAFGAQGSASTKTDCSLYTQNVFKKVGIELPRSSADQSMLGKAVSKDDLQIGDLLFFKTYKREPSHVGIYLGENKMIHASFKDKRVMIDDISKTYYSKRFLFAKRHEF